MTMIRYTLFAAALCSGLMTHSLAADEPEPVWKNLPPDTIALVRIPDGKGWRDSFKGTRFSEVILKKARIDGIIEFINKMSGGEFTEIMKGVNEKGFSLEDWWKLFDGEIGASLSMHVHPLGGKKKQVIYVLFWAEPERELGDRLFDALSKHDDLERKDITADGLTLHRFKYDGDKALYVHRQGKRFYVLAGESGHDEEAVENLTKLVTGGFKKDPQTPYAKWRRKGITEAINMGGTSYFTAAIFIQPLLEMFPRGTPTPSGKSVDEMIKLAGVDRLGPLVMASGKKGEQTWFGMLVSAPKPRTGLVSLLNLPSVPAKPKAWVPADVVGYQHIGWNPAQVLQVVTKFVVAVGPPNFQMQLDEQMMMAAVMMGGVELKDLLGAFDSQVTFVDFGSQIQKGTLTTTTDRIGIVFDLKTNEHLKKLLPMAQAMAQNQESMAYVVEQDVPGLRIELPTMGLEAGIFLTDRELIIGFGKGVSEQVLSGIKKPGNGLAKSDVVKDSRGALIASRDVCMWGVQDINRGLQLTVDALKGQLESASMALPEGVTIQSLLKLFPTEDEMKNLFGPNSARGWVDDRGLNFRSVMVMPKAE